MGQKINVDIDALQDLVRQLRSARAGFDGVEGLTRAAGEFLGASNVSDKVESFGKNWSDKRKEISENIDKCRRSGGRRPRYGRSGRAGQRRPRRRGRARRRRVDRGRLDRGRSGRRPDRRTCPGRRPRGRPQPTWPAAAPPGSAARPPRTSRPRRRPRTRAASGALQAAVRQMSAAMEIRDGAAGTCSKKIDDAIHDDLKNETGFWHALKKIGGAILDAFEKLAPILRTIATVLGVAAALLCWVPVLGEVLAGAALVVSAVTLAMDLTLKAAGRDVSWGNIALDALGCIPLGRATRLAKGANPMKWGEVAKGVLKGDKAQLGKLVGYGRSVVSNIGPAYQGILGAGERLATKAPAALAEMGRSLAEPFTAAAGKVTLGSAVTGLRTVATKEIGPVGLGLTAKKVYGLFTGDGGASTSASAPANPATLSSGLPVTSSSPIRTVVTQPVALPAAV